MLGGGLCLRLIMRKQDTKILNHDKKNTLIKRKSIISLAAFERPLTDSYVKVQSLQKGEWIENPSTNDPLDMPSMRA